MKTIENMIERALERNGVDDNYYLLFYRTDQATHLHKAIRDGSVRRIALDGPSKNLLDGCAADAVELIGIATDMMEHGVKISYTLMRGDAVIDTTETVTDEAVKRTIQAMRESSSSAVRRALSGYEHGPLDEYTDFIETCTLLREAKTEEGIDHAIRLLAKYPRVGLKFIVDMTKGA